MRSKSIIVLAAILAVTIVASANAITVFSEEIEQGLIQLVTSFKETQAW